MLAEYKPNTASLILADVKKAQRHASGYKITKEDIEKVLQIVAERPYGALTAITVNNLDIGDREIVLDVYWYSWRRKKWIDWSIKYRSFNSNNNLPSKFNIMLKDEQKDSIWNSVFTDRYHRYVDIMHSYRRLRQRGYVLPPDAKDIYVKNKKYGMILIECHRYSEYDQMYLCSPLGYIKVDPNTSSIDAAAKSVGLRIPRDKEKRTWENIEPSWVMVQQKKMQ